MSRGGVAAAPGLLPTTPTAAGPMTELRLVDRARAVCGCSPWLASRSSYALASAATVLLSSSFPNARSTSCVVCSPPGAVTDRRDPCTPAILWCCWWRWCCDRAVDSADKLRDVASAWPLGAKPTTLAPPLRSVGNPLVTVRAPAADPARGTWAGAAVANSRCDAEAMRRCVDSGWWCTVGLPWCSRGCGLATRAATTGMPAPPTCMCLPRWRS